MILFHRLTPLIVTLVLVISFGLLTFAPGTLWTAVVLMFVAVPLLLGRLLLFDYRRAAFWVFLSLPVLLILSSFAFLLFLESAEAKIFLAIAVVAAVGLYTENLFTFYHLPNAYQAYSLEYLALFMAVLSAFFFANASYAAHTFLHEYFPVWAPALLTFAIIFVLTLATFWVSKVGFETSRRFAIVAGCIFSELSVVLAFLPSSFTANAALLAACYYCYLGLMRAHVLERLSPQVLRRYALMTSVLVVLTLVTSPWL